MSSSEVIKMRIDYRRVSDLPSLLFPVIGLVQRVRTCKFSICVSVVYFPVSLVCIIFTGAAMHPVDW